MRGTEDENFPVLSTHLGLRRQLGEMDPPQTQQNTAPEKGRKMTIRTPRLVNRIELYGYSFCWAADHFAGRGEILRGAVFRRRTGQFRRRLRTALPRHGRGPCFQRVRYPAAMAPFCMKPLRFICVSSSLPQSRLQGMRPQLGIGPHAFAASLTHGPTSWQPRTRFLRGRHA